MKPRRKDAVGIAAVTMLFLSGQRSQSPAPHAGLGSIFPTTAVCRPRSRSRWRIA